MYKSLRMPFRIIRSDRAFKVFDYEMGYKALKKIRKSNLKIKTCKIRHPWDNACEFNFDISKLPKNKKQVDPLSHVYPEEWLLRYELLNTASTRLRDRAHAELKALSKSHPDLAELIGTNHGMLEESVA